MAPFISPKVIISGFKEKVDAMAVQGDRLYIGTAVGNVHVYSIDDSTSEDGEETVNLVHTKNLGRRPIEQLGFIKDINSLVVLSESTVTLYPLPTMGPPSSLIKAKSAFSFIIHTSIQHLSSDGTTELPSNSEAGRTELIPTLVTHLVVGCRRKVAIYSWKDGEPQEVKESPLPHSPRAMAFLDNDTVCLAYSPTEYALFSLLSLSTTDISTPVSVSTSSTGIGAFTGLTGYMTLGLGAKAKPGVLQISESEVLIIKDNDGFFIGIDAKPSRSASFSWPAPPEEIAFVKPYIFSILPPSSVPTLQTDNTVSSGSTQVPTPLIQTSIVQIRSSISTFPTQTLSFPFNTTRSPTLLTNTPSTTLRLMTPSPSFKAPLFFVSVPTDRSTATAEGSSVWEVHMKTWAEQIDELVYSSHYADALTLLDTIDQAVLSDKEQRRTRIRALNAVSQFRALHFDKAIDTFLELDVNPAKVVALYPEIVAGRLAVPQEEWIPLYGGPAKVGESPSTTSPGDLFEGKIRESPSLDLQGNKASPAGTLRGKFKTGLGVLMPSQPKEDDASSVSSKPNVGVHDDLTRSVETLVRYLSDRRPKVGAALEALHITPANQSHEIHFLSETSIEELFAQPNTSLSLLTPQQLLRFAQIVDTALFKSYLVIRPGLLGPLCRVPNWCEVEEVEEELRAREKFAELVYLYNGKKMHAKALDLLRQLSEKETNTKDKLTPSISYLQKLGPEHLEQIFESSQWIFEQDRGMAFEIFTSEDVELPRQAVADYLEGIDPQICARYLEYLVRERHDETPVFHNRLAELYLKMTLAARKRGDEKLQRDVYSRLLQFIDTTNYYKIDRMYGLLSSEDLYEARAILLGRLGRHDQALELYVYQLCDYIKAEEYCKRVYQPATETSNVFLTLLRIYLQPTTRTASDLLRPALELISRHSPRLDAVETLQLLPPLVTAKDVNKFLLEALMAPVVSARVVRHISKGRNDQLARTLMLLQSKRVKVTDSRICPQCHKRIGNSVIVVHAPRGEVTHYQCREAFSRKLNETRH